MKALNIQQPFASAVAWGGKTIEMKSSITRYRGDVIIVASNKKPSGYEPWQIPAIEEAIGHRLEYGKAICVANLYDSRLLTPDDFPRAFNFGWTLDEIPTRVIGWFFKDIRPIEPFEVKGKLNLYDVKLEKELKYLTPNDGNIINTSPNGDTLYWDAPDPNRCLWCMHSLIDYDLPAMKDLFDDLSVFESFIESHVTSDCAEEMNICHVYRGGEFGEKPRKITMLHEPCEYYFNPWATFHELKRQNE